MIVDTSAPMLVTVCHASSMSVLAIKDSPDVSVKYHVSNEITIKRSQ